MRIRKILTFVALAVALSACEQPTTPTTEAVDVEPAFSRDRGPVVESVTGFGLFTEEDGGPTTSSTFSFTSILMAAASRTRSSAR